MIKILINSLCLVILMANSPPVKAKLFRSKFVCMPKVKPSDPDLEFYIRGNVRCNESEEWMEVYPQKSGGYLLMPSYEPLDPKLEKEYQEMIKYYRGEP